ncbi:MAG: hypothetical protein V7631_2288 [Massilia sp.]
MSASTITQTQAKGLRHQFNSAYGAVRAFSNGLYAAHGGWHPAAPARSAGQQGRNAQARG